MSGSERRRRAAGALLALALLSPGCGGSSGTGGSAKAQAGESDFDRHLRLGVEQLRRGLVDSARAELDKCAGIRSGDPELVFQRARVDLATATRTDELPPIIAHLDKVLEADPPNVKARRLLYEIHVLAGSTEADRLLVSAGASYGDIGALEMEQFSAGLRDPAAITLDRLREGGAVGTEYRTFVSALAALKQRGSYAPGPALPVVESYLSTYADLAALRFVYAKHLVTANVRVPQSKRSDLPPMSSKLILDDAQSQFEKAFDQISPQSRLADAIVVWLGKVALLMGDYEEVAARCDQALSSPRLTGALRSELTARKGLARMKQGRFSEAIELLESAAGGLREGSDAEIETRWILHLAYEGAGTPPGARRMPFEFRPDLVLDPARSPLRYEDIAAKAGVDKRDGLGPSAWGDYDGDGDFDLFVSGCDSYGALYRNDGGSFTDVSREAGLFNAQSGYSATFADYDGDGLVDLYVGRDGWNGPALNSLYRNKGDGTFEDVAAEAGLTDPGSSFVHAWSDVDRDGDLDLYVAHGIAGTGETNRLYRNEGGGKFTDATEEAGLSEPPGTRTIGFAFGDYDRDGWPDIFVSGVTAANRLYHNRGDGTFEEVAKSAGVAAADLPTTGYVAFMEDFDGDGWPDILKTSLAAWPSVLRDLEGAPARRPEDPREVAVDESPRLYRNNHDGTFTDVTAKAGLDHPVGVMGAMVADADNDGFPDIYLGTGDPQIERMEPDRFYRNNGDGTFTDITFAAGLGNVGKGHGVTFADVDHDGSLEIYAPEGGFVHGDAWPNALYVNRKPTGNHWLQVDLEGVKSNRGGIGASLLLRAGALTVLREMKDGEGFGSSNSPTVEFGLGPHAKIDSLEIRWPSGVVQRFEDLRPDTGIRVREGERWRLAGEAPKAASRRPQAPPSGS